MTDLLSFILYSTSQSTWKMFFDSHFCFRTLQKTMDIYCCRYTSPGQFSRQSNEGRYDTIRQQSLAWTQKLSVI